MIWAPDRQISARHCLLAGVLAAALPVVLALGSYWLAPGVCDPYPSLCRTYLSLLVAAPVVAISLPALLCLNRRRPDPFPDGGLAIVLLAGVLAQLLISGCSLWLLAPYIRAGFLFEALVVPEGFVAGAVVGAVFSVSLARLGSARSARG